MAATAAPMRPPSTATTPTVAAAAAPPFSSPPTTKQESPGSSPPQRCTSLLLPRRGRISIRPSAAAPATASSNANNKKHSGRRGLAGASHPPLSPSAATAAAHSTHNTTTTFAQPISFTLAASDSLYSPPPSSTFLSPPSPDPASRSPPIRQSPSRARSLPNPATPPPSSFSLHRRATLLHPSSAAKQQQSRADTQSPAPSSWSRKSLREQRGSLTKAAAARILRGHRKPPQPPNEPLPLVATLMADAPDGDAAAQPQTPTQPQPQEQPQVQQADDGPHEQSHDPASAPSTSAKAADALSQGSTKGRSEHQSSSTLEPIDVREVLSKCDDPTMSWSLQFWVTIADPLTHDVFFACPASGQCSWEPPVGAYVLPRSPDGEWWELADASRGNQSYYYNTLTRVTQWNRPDGDAFVIPLGLIQRTALSSRPSSPKRSNSTENATVESHVGSVRFANSASPVNGEQPQPSPPPAAATSTASSSGPLTPIPDDAPMPDQQGGWWGQRHGRRLLNRLSKASLKSSKNRSPSSAPNGSPAVSNGHATILTNGGHIVASPPSSPCPDHSQHSHHSHTDQGSVNLILQPASPTTATYQLDNFSTDNFADRYFTSRRSGVLRHRMSLEQIMEWQRTPITSPLLVLSKTSVHDAITTFKVIQHVMGERDRSVSDARTPSGHAAASVLSLRLTARDDGKDEKTVILEEIRWVIQMGVGRIEMRDELYCQLMKQLTRNPDKDSTVLGFQLFCVFVSAFGPSKSFEPFVRSFLIGKLDLTEYGIGVMAKYCLTRLDTWSQKGGRGRVLSTAEIEHASDAAFYPSVYGQTLETIMQRQEGAYPELRIPIILPFLADGILALGGTDAEGIFRVPGDNDAILHLKAKIDRGQYQLSGVEDPHVVASLFKLWLRELEDPLIPTPLYEMALEASKTVDNTVLFMKKLPSHNRRVLLFVVSFIQLFLDREVVNVTKMTPRNLALVLAPNILRTPDESLAAAFANSGYECQFVLNLLLHLDPPTVDPEYVPLHGAAGRRSTDSDISIDLSGSLQE